MAFSARKVRFILHRSKISPWPDKPNNTYIPDLVYLLLAHMNHASGRTALKAVPAFSGNHGKAHLCDHVEMLVKPGRTRKTNLPRAFELGIGGVFPEKHTVKSFSHKHNPEFRAAFVRGDE
jgi:hypothetical protein